MRLPWSKKPRRQEEVMLEEDYDIEALQDLPYSGEFDLTRKPEIRNILLVQDAEEEGRPFIIRKLLKEGSLGGMAREVTRATTFPTRPELWDMVKDSYGGGSYQVYVGTRPVKGYVFEADAKWAPGGRPKDLKGRVMEGIERDVEAALEADPELKAQVVAQVLKKSLGISTTVTGAKKETWKEQKLREWLENNPAEMEAYMQRLAKKAGYAEDEEEDEGELESATKAMEKVKRFTDAMGVGEKQPSIIGDIIRGAMTPPAGGGDSLAQTLAKVFLGGQKDAPVTTERPALPAPRIERLPDATPRIGGQESPPNTPREVEVIPPRTTSQLQMPAALKLDGVNVASEDLLGLLSAINWQEVEAGVKGDAGVFVQAAYLKQEEGGDKASAVLLAVLRENPTQDVYGALMDAKLYIERQDVRMGAIAMLGQDTYNSINTVVNYLLTEAGVQWLTHARAAALYIQRRIESDATNPPPVEAGVVAPSSNGASNVALHSPFSGDGDEDEEHSPAFRS